MLYHHPLLYQITLPDPAYLQNILIVLYREYFKGIYISRLEWFEEGLRLPVQMKRQKDIKRFRGKLK
jgi:hypothetical protein